MRNLKVILHSHCQAGMVFAINAPTTGKTFAAFQVSLEVIA